MIQKTCVYYDGIYTVQILEDNILFHSFGNQITLPKICVSVYFLTGREILPVVEVQKPTEKMIIALEIKGKSLVYKTLIFKMLLLKSIYMYMQTFTFLCMSITNSRSSLKLMSIKQVMPFNHFILCCPLLLLPSIFPASGSFPMSQFFASGGLNI